LQVTDPHEPDGIQVDPELIRARAYEIAEGWEAGTPEENWLRAERELTVAHDYDTVERDLERLEMTVSRLPTEAGVVWRLRLPRGERLETWEPGDNGLTPRDEIARLLSGVVGQKQLVPSPPLSTDPGAIRLREMIEAQRQALLRHDPGTRLGEDPENLHQHRVAARRVRAFLRATRAYVDPTWRRLLNDPLRQLGQLTGPVRDLEVLIEYVRGELGGLREKERADGEALVARLDSERASARQLLLPALDADAYHFLLTRLRLPPRLASHAKGVPLRRIARKEFRRLVKAIERLGSHPDDTAIHTLRITLKRARYAAELAAPGGKVGERFLADAKALQDLLGQHQDAAVAEERLRTVTVVNLETAIAFAAGRLAERQRARREQVTERLPLAWKRLRTSGRRLR
jgi:CHAD domain-containing protein